MKIVFLVKSSVLMHYYVNVVHERFPVAHIVQEVSPRVRPAQPSLLHRLRGRGLLGVGKAVLSRGAKLMPKAPPDPLIEKSRRQLDEILGERAAGFPSDVPITRVDDINSEAVRKCLVDTMPDVILVQGTSIVRDATLPAGVTNFNMHAGLSPYYRGGQSAAWALVNWDPYNIGVTLHRLTERADAGDIIAQRRVVPTEDDTSSSIGFKLTREGAALAVKVLERLASGGALQSYPQELTCGHCYLSMHFFPELREVVKRIDREGLIAQMLRRPSTRVRHAIIEWPSDADAGAPGQ